MTSDEVSKATGPDSSEVHADGFTVNPKLLRMRRKYPVKNNQGAQQIVKNHITGDAWAGSPFIS